LILADPEKVHTLLMSRNHTKFRSKAYKQAAEQIPGAPGILFQDGKQWQERLQQVMPVFTKANLLTYSTLLSQISQKAVKSLKEKGTSEDFYLDITELGLKLVLELGYGLDSTQPDVQAYGKALRDYKLHTMYKSYRIDRIGFGNHQIFSLPRFFKGIKELDTLMMEQSKLLQNVLSNPKNRNGIQPNWTDILKEAGLNFKAQCDELNHIYGAFNAIDYTVTCALFELGKHEQTQKKLTYELKELAQESLCDWKRHPVDIPFTIAFMKEVFRYYPVSIAVIRSTGESIKAAGKTWPAGTETFLFLQSLHFNEEYWDEPEKFDPTRFMKEIKEPKAYIPFLTGSRKCIGQHLAELHFLHVIHAFAKSGFPKISGKFQIQPYLIPRLEYPLHAEYH
jgi:cytochrome P450